MQDHSKAFGKQHILCNVQSCVYHDDRGECCTLERITVQPNGGVQNGLAQDESCCGSYRCRE